MQKNELVEEWKKNTEKKKNQPEYKRQENAMWNKYKEHLDAMRKCWII